MAKYTITPWRSTQDLLEVRSQLYRSTEDDRRRHAVDRVMAWKLRGNLPHAVESTALLIDAILHHSNPDNSIFSVRAVYSAAFTRFVTGFCDIGRNKERSLEPSSMLDIARQIGMPVEFVALRHEATHEELPAVLRLVKAVEDGLGWLWTVYWSRLEEPQSHEDTAASLAQSKADARQILRGFRSRRREAVKNKRKYKWDTSDLLQTMRASLQFFGQSTAKMETWVDVLIEDKLLIPSRRELGSSMEGAYVIWEELFRFIMNEHRRLAPVLIRGMVEALSRPSDVPPGEDAEKEALCLWLNHLLEWSPLNPLFVPGERYLFRKDIMTWCCTHPGYWSQRLGRDILHVETPDFQHEWREVFEASLLANAGTVPQALAPASPSLLKDVSWQRHERDLGSRRVSGDDSELGNWVQAAKASNNPIGVV